MNNSEYSATISFAFENEEQQTIVLDTVSDTSINESSTITTHPVVSGDIVADHMFKNPISLSLSGEISLNGSNKAIVVSNGVIHLSDVESLFERIKNEAVECTIVKISIKDNAPKFLVRENMVLNGISWTEKTNSLGFNLSFIEILKVDVQEIDVDTDDEFLPDVSAPQSSSFTDELLDLNQVYAKLNDELIQNDLMEEEFLAALKSYGVSELISLGLAIGLAAAIANGLNPIGWAIGIIFILGAGLNGILKAIERRKYRIERFEYYKNETKQQKEIKRYGDLLEELKKVLDSLNDSIKVYKISSNSSQECIVTIDDSLHVFIFTKNNLDGFYTISIEDENGIKKLSNYSVTGANTSFDQLTDAACLIRGNENNREGSYVYLLRYGEDAKDISNYYILVSEFSIEKEYNQRLTDCIKRVFLKGN